MKRLSSILIASLLLIQAFPVKANEPVDYEIPKTSIAQFDRLESSGGFIVRDIRALKALGYDPSRTWQPGDSVADTIQLSDLNKITPITDKSYDQIFKSSGVQASSVRLGDTPLLKRQTIGDWLKANPDKVNIALKSYPALRQLVAGEWNSSVVAGWNIASEHSKEFQKVLEDHPELKDLPIGSIVNGDWKGTLPYAQQLALKEIDRHLPEHLKGLPSKSLGVVDDLRKGNFDRAAVGAVSIADALRKSPNLKDVPLGVLGDDVPISAIPGLKDTPIGKLAGWEGSKASETPGLKETPLDYVSINTIIGLLNGDLFGALDVPRNEAELKADNPISGGTRGGPLTPEPCVVTDKEQKSKTSKATACPNIELQDVDSKKSLGGKQWVSGKFQKVKGGKGFLKKINGGWEPTGLKPWGPKPPLKLVLMEVAEMDGKQIQTPTGITISEKAGYGKFAMYAQFCVKKGFVDLGCSPHFIGPIPFVLHPKVRQNGRVLIASSSGPPPIPDEWQRRIDGYRNQYAPQCAPSDAPTQGESGDVETKYGHKKYEEANRKGLKYYNTVGDYDNYLQPEVIDPLDQLLAEAKAEGVELSVGDAHRTVDEQAKLFSDRGGNAETAKGTAPPGYSEHHTGYVVDFSGPGGGSITEGSAEHRFLQRKAKQYGFEQSFKGDGPVKLEAWHWRYVGSEKARQALHLETGHHAHDGHDHDGHAHDGHDNTKPGDAAISSVRRPKDEREEFMAKSVALAKKYKIDPVDLLTVMSFETKGTFRPNIFNESGSGAVGLIQFMPRTAQGLGTSTHELTQMSRVEQLDVVDRYLADVGIQPGDNLPTLYASVLTGSRGGNRNSSDGSYTVNTAVQDMGSHRQKAIALLKGAENLDTSGYTFSGGEAVDCVAGSGGSGNFVQGDGKSTGRFIRPVDRGIDSAFRSARRPTHNGTDHFVPIGTPIKAADGGVVVAVKTDCPQIGVRGSRCGRGHGNLVYIQHKDGSQTRYAHLSTAKVKNGDPVSQGQIIGTSGTSGSSEGPHLHFEILDSTGNYLNPANHLQ